MQHTINLQLMAFAHAITNSHRVAILFLLEKYQMVMNITIVNNLKICQSQASRHLRILVEQQLIIKEKIGSTIIYTLNILKWNLVKALISGVCLEG
jgi:predicted transcriptional regulator